MKWSRIGSAALLLFAFTACEGLDQLTDLDVENQNNPDRELAIATAGDVQSLISGSFLTWWRGWQGSYSGFGCPGGALATAADEVTMSWGNFGMQQLSSEPRVAWPNSPSWSYRCHVEHPWYQMYEGLSSIYDGVRAIEDNPAFGDEINTERALAFARFMQGISHGVLAAFFDSAFVFDETVDLENDVLTLQAYPEVWAAARGYLNDAITRSQSATWSLPTTWINGNAVTGPQLAQLAHSFLARWEAQVARTPAERAAVNWGTIIGHVDNGVADDFFITADDNLWWSAPLWWSFNPDPTWGRADYKTIGPADNAGNYTTWLSTAVADRLEFEIVTDDARVTAAGDPQGAGLDFEFMGPSAFDALRGIYHFSMYRGTRYEAHSIAPTAFLSDMPLFQRVELDLLKAEGLIRTNNLPAAAGIIDQTRVTRGGLPTAAGASESDMMDMMIYEKRLENYGACVGCAYFDRRGWGPLVDSRGSPVGTHHRGPVEGTPLHFPIPGKELEVLQLPVYTYGGVGSEGAALGHPAAAPAASSSGTAVPAKQLYQFRGLESIQAKLEYLRSGKEDVIPEGVKSLPRYH